MSGCGRVCPLTMCIRKRRQMATFVACVIVCLTTLSTVQYLVTSVMFRKCSPDPDLDDERLVLDPDFDNVRDRQVAGDRKTLGIDMPTIDYRTFKELELRKAVPSDEQVLKVAREAMLEPAGRGRMKIRSIAKTGQALMVDQILKNKTDGFFVECGAFDGETASNTVYLERVRRWTGLLVEMDAAFYTQLVGKKRNAWSINACLSAKHHLIEMNYFESNGQLGRLADDPDPPADDRDSAPGQRRRAARPPPPNSALCFPLESLLLALNRTHVDYFSLDVEGFELDILRSIPFDRLDIDVVSAEFLHSREPHDEYTKLMTGYGYRTYGRVRNMDFVFVKQSVIARGGRRRVDETAPIPRRRNPAATGRRKVRGRPIDDAAVDYAEDARLPVAAAAAGGRRSRGEDWEVRGGEDVDDRVDRAKPRRAREPIDDKENDNNIIYNN